VYLLVQAFSFRL